MQKGVPQGPVSGTTALMVKYEIFIEINFIYTYRCHLCQRLVIIFTIALVITVVKSLLLLSNSVLFMSF